MHNIMMRLLTVNPYLLWQKISLLNLSFLHISSPVALNNLGKEAQFDFS